MTCTRPKTYFKNEKGAWKTAWKQYISSMKDTVKSTTGQRAFPLHMFFGVVLFASISKYGLVQFWPLSLCHATPRERVLGQLFAHVSMRSSFSYFSS